MDERDEPIKDADVEVTPPSDEESDHNFAAPEMAPEEIAAKANRNPFMEIEEETLPEDFRPIL
jgi:hypothetical protein